MLLNSSIKLHSLSACSFVVSKKMWNIRSWNHHLFYDWREGFYNIAYSKLKYCKIWESTSTPLDKLMSLLEIITWHESWKYSIAMSHLFKQLIICEIIETKTKIPKFSRIMSVGFCVSFTSQNEEKSQLKIYSILNSFLSKCLWLNHDIYHHMIASVEVFLQ